MKRTFSIALFLMMMFSASVLVLAQDDLPSKYDPRALKMVSRVKDQGTRGTCWSFADLSLLESYLINKGLANSDIDFSEEHLVDWSRRDLTGYGWNKDEKEGGNSLISSGYLSSFSGPVLERDFPYNKTPINDVPKNFYVINKPYRVTDIMVLRTNSKDEIKQTILNCGAVSTCMYQDFKDLASLYPQYYNRGNRTAYYYPSKPGIQFNHRVLVVGWDDNYSLENFNPENRPKSNGAWLIKNSAGTQYYDKGFMWVSYEDVIKCFSFAIAIKGAVPVENPKDIKIYQHDEYGSICDFNGYNVPLKDVRKLETAVIYNFDSEHSNLDSIMISSPNEGAKYKMYYVPVRNDELITDRDKYILLGEGKLGHRGYISLKPDIEFKIPSGKGGILVSLDASDKNEMAYIGCEQDIFYVKDNEVKFTFKSKSVANSSFEYINGNFYLIKSENGTLVNLSIKVVAKRK